MVAEKNSTDRLDILCNIGIIQNSFVFFFGFFGGLHLKVAWFNLLGAKDINSYLLSLAVNNLR